MSNLKETFQKSWLLKFTYHFHDNFLEYQKLITSLTDLSIISNSWNIYYDKTKASLKNPYFSNEKLDFHNDGLWEDNINPAYLFLKCNKKAEDGWENFFVDSKVLIKSIPQSYFDLKYTFSLFSENKIEPLFIKHPMGWYPCLNYSSYWIDIDGNSNYIKFIWVDDKENKEMNSYLCSILEENKFFVDLNEGECVIFDNYRYLHWRNWFSWYRELERILVYYNQ